MKCINCGNEIMNGQKFCPSCGSPAPEQATQPAYQQPMPPAPKKNNTALIAIIIVLVLIVAGLAGVLVYKSVTDKDNNSDIKTSQTDDSKKENDKKDNKKDDKIQTVTGLKPNQISINGKTISLNEDTLSIFEDEYYPYIAENDRLEFKRNSESLEDGESKLNYSNSLESGFEFEDPFYNYTSFHIGDFIVIIQYENENTPISDYKIVGVLNNDQNNIQNNVITAYGEFRYGQKLDIDELSSNLDAIGINTFSEEDLENASIFDKDFSGYCYYKHAYESDEKSTYAQLIIVNKEYILTLSTSNDIIDNLVCLQSISSLEDENEYIESMQDDINAQIEAANQVSLEN